MNRFYFLALFFVFSGSAFTQNDNFPSIATFGNDSVVFIEMGNTEIAVLKLDSANLNFELIENTVKEIQNRQKWSLSEYDGAVERKRMSQQMEQYRDDILWKKWQKFQLDFAQMLTPSEISTIQKVSVAFLDNELNKKALKSLKSILKKYQKFLDEAYKETEILSASRLNANSKSLSKNERLVLFILKAV